jgi:hypothetical protein
MIRFYFILLLISATTVCCSHKNKSIVPGKTGKAAPVFFPVTVYITGQIGALNQLQVTPLKITTIHEHQDSVWIKLQDVEIFAEPFTHPVIDSATLSQFYSESSFLDQTINAITLSYDPLTYQHDPLSLKSLVVYIDPQTNKVTRIYIEKSLPANKGTRIQQLTWKSDSWCKITTITENENSPAEIKEEKVIWNFDRE